MGKGGNTVPSITNAEHIGPNDTGDNIEAKRVAGYVWDGANWQRSASPLIDMAADEIVLSGYSNGVPGTIEYKKGGVTQRTLTLTVDGSGNITDIVRT